MNRTSAQTMDLTGLAFEAHAHESEILIAEIFIDRSYDLPGWISAPAQVLDIGANIGVFTAFALQEWPGCRVTAVEPIPAIARTLRMNFAGTDRVEVIEIAISDDEAQIEMNYFPNCTILSGVNVTPDQVAQLVANDLTRWSAGLSETARVVAGRIVETLVAERSTVESVTVQSETLGSVVSRIGYVDLLKIDIEGSEVLALSSLTREEWRRIGNIAVEPKLSGRDIEVVRALLEKNGFDLLSSPTPAADRKPFLATQRSPRS